MFFQDLYNMLSFRISRIKEIRGRANYTSVSKNNKRRGQ